MVTQVLPVALQPKGNKKAPKFEPTVRPTADTFANALLELPSEYKHRNPISWVASLTFQVMVISALAIAPLIFTQALDLKALQTTWISAPAPPAPPPPPAPMMQRIARPMARLMQAGKLMAPVAIPKQVTIIKEAEPPDEAVGVVGGVPGGIPGGQTGGVLGGIIGGTGTSGPPPPPPAHRIVRVGGDLKPPRPITRPDPAYPILAKQARIQGVVIIDAVIDESGSVVQARAISGPPLLIPSALAAVMQWRYEPSFLDGQPISVAMHVDVTFELQ
jgi:periplasmic protein TonB